jgi:hypothetical protein
VARSCGHGNEPSGGFLRRIHLHGVGWLISQLIIHTKQEEKLYFCC